MSQLSLKDSFKGNASFRPTVAIALGAIAGASSRYYLGKGIEEILGSQFPYGTLIANLTGSGAMGFLTTILLSKSLRAYPDLRLLLTTGFLGSYTTFSSYALETIALLEEGQLGLSLLYWAASILLGFMGLISGILVAKAGLKSWESLMTDD